MYAVQTEKSRAQVVVTVDGGVYASTSTDVVMSFVYTDYGSLQCIGPLNRSRSTFSLVRLSHPTSLPVTRTPRLPRGARPWRSGRRLPAT